MWSPGPALPCPNSKVLDSQGLVLPLGLRPGPEYTVPHWKMEWEQAEELGAPPETEVESGPAASSSQAGMEPQG